MFKIKSFHHLMCKCWFAMTLLGVFLFGLDDYRVLISIIIVNIWTATSSIIKSIENN